MELEDVKELTDRFIEVTNEAAMEMLGRRRIKKQPCMTRKILEACDERRELKAAKFQDDNSEMEYRRANARVKKEFRTTKDNFLRDKCQQMQHAFANKNSKKGLCHNQETTQKAAIKTPAIEAADGTLLTNENKIQER